MYTEKERKVKKSHFIERGDKYERTRTNKT